MLQNHERAARMHNEPGVTWHRFVQSRFIGHGGGKVSVCVDIQGAAQTSISHAELRGLLEYSTDSALPVVAEFEGTLDLDSREVRIDASATDDVGRGYSGRLSENGRVLTLLPGARGKAAAKPLYLIHEETLRELFAD